MARLCRHSHVWFELENIPWIMITVWFSFLWFYFYTHDFDGFYIQIPRGCCNGNLTMEHYQITRKPEKKTVWIKLWMDRIRFTYGALIWVLTVITAWSGYQNVTRPQITALLMSVCMCVWYETSISICCLSTSLQSFQIKQSSINLDVLHKYKLYNYIQASKFRC